MAKKHTDTITNDVGEGLLHDYLAYFSDKLVNMLYANSDSAQTPMYRGEPAITFTADKNQPKVSIAFQLSDHYMEDGLIGYKFYTHVFQWKCTGKQGRYGSGRNLAPEGKDPMEYVLGFAQTMNYIEDLLNNISNQKRVITVTLGTMCQRDSTQGIIRFIDIFFDKNLEKSLRKSGWKAPSDLRTTRTAIIDGVRENRFNQQAQGVGYDENSQYQNNQKPQPQGWGNTDMGQSVGEPNMVQYQQQAQPQQPLQPQSQQPQQPQQQVPQGNYQMQYQEQQQQVQGQSQGYGYDQQNYSQASQYAQSYPQQNPYPQTNNYNYNYQGSGNEQYQQQVADQQNMQFAQTAYTNEPHPQQGTYSQTNGGLQESYNPYGHH